MSSCLMIMKILQQLRNSYKKIMCTPLLRHLSIVKTVTDVTIDHTLTYESEGITFSNTYQGSGCLPPAELSR